MPVVRVKGVANPMQFPDDMDINDIREFLRRRFTRQAVAGNQPIDLAPLQGQARASEQSLAQKAGQGISNALVDSGIISDRFGAQQIGKNVTSIGEFLPGIGDAAAGDEFGRALKQGDNFGMAMGALGAIPLVGDAAKKSISKAMSAGGDVDRTKELKEEGFNLEGTWFHGSDKEFDKFDFGKIGQNYDSHYGKGAYFASRYNHASEHGEVKNYKLGIKNPMKWSLEKVKEARVKGMELSDYAKSLGHDGILIGDRNNAQIVAFDNSQIKIDKTEY